MTKTGCLARFVLNARRAWRPETKRGASEVTRSEEQILRDLEELRQKLKIKAGLRYDPEKIQEASETSELFDQVFLEYLNLQVDKKRS